MKEKLTLRNAIIWTAALVALILFFCSFGATTTLNGTIEGDYINMITPHAVWGSKSISGYSAGHYFGVFLQKPVGNACGIIGSLLLFLAAGGLVVITLLLKNEKTAKILTFVCGGAMLVAGVLLFFVGETPWYVLKEWMLEEEGQAVTIEQIKQQYVGFKASSGFGIGGGIVSILFAAGVVASQFIPDKKFVK